MNHKRLDIPCEEEQPNDGGSGPNEAAVKALRDMLRKSPSEWRIVEEAALEAGLYAEFVAMVERDGQDGALGVDLVICSSCGLLLTERGEDCSVCAAEQD